MVETTYDALPSEAQELLDKGEPVRLYDWTNVAPGTPGYYVQMLERFGLWRILKLHIATDPMGSYCLYGPA